MKHFFMIINFDFHVKHFSPKNNLIFKIYDLQPRIEPILTAIVNFDLTKSLNH